MSGWMESLGRHYKETKRRYPGDNLMILFDVDGTIVDMRYAVIYVLKDFDRHFHTGFFENLLPADITLHESRVEPLFKRLGIPGPWQRDILEWYKGQYWATRTIIHSHRPFEGVMSVIGWFQKQPKTFVGLNTGRPEFLRRDTLLSLNAQGQDDGALFRGEYLHMNRVGWEHSVPRSKVEGLLHFQAAAYRVFAMVDNEPANLEAISQEDPEGEILLLHADTIFESRRRRLPLKAVSGEVYDLSALIREPLPFGRAPFAWQGAQKEMGTGMHLLP